MRQVETAATARFQLFRCTSPARRLSLSLQPSSAATTTTTTTTAASFPPPPFFFMPGSGNTIRRPLRVTRSRRHQANENRNDASETARRLFRNLFFSQFIQRYGWQYGWRAPERSLLPSLSLLVAESIRGVLISRFIPRCLGTTMRLPRDAVLIAMHQILSLKCFRERRRFSSGTRREPDERLSANMNSIIILATGSASSPSSRRHRDSFISPFLS